MQMLPLWVKTVGWGWGGILSVLCWTEGGEKTLLISPFVFRPKHQERFLKDSSSATELTQAKWTGGWGAKTKSGGTAGGTAGAGWQKDCLPASATHLPTKCQPTLPLRFHHWQASLYCYFFFVVFFNPLGHVDKLESKQTVCGGESPLIGMPPLFETLLRVGSHDFLPCVLRPGARMKRRLTEHRLRVLRKNGKGIMGSFAQEGKVITARNLINVPTKRKSNHRIWFGRGGKMFLLFNFYCTSTKRHCDMGGQATGSTNTPSYCSNTPNVHFTA